MKKRFNWQSVLVLTLVLTLVLAGCGKSNNNNNNNTSSTSETTDSPATAAENVDTSKEVKLKMYLLGEKPKDFDLVYDEVNKLLRTDINATVDVTFLSWSDWGQKYPLLFASGDDFDLIYTSNWAQYNTQASKGGFLEVTQDMLDKYMPKTAANMYPDAWEQAKINGKVFMIPNNYKETQGNFTILRGDLMDKYGLKVEDVMKDSKSIEKYFEAFVKDEKKTPIMGGGTSWWGMPLYIPVEKMKNWFEASGLGNYHIYYDASQASPKLFPFIDTDAFVEGVKVTKEWVDKGIVSKSALVNKSSDGDEFLNGKVPNGGGNLLTTNSKFIAVKNQHPEWNPIILDANYGNPVDLKPFTQNGVGINRVSKNPERAMMMLDLFRNDERYFNLTTYGIKGKHFNLSDDGKSIVPLADNASFAPDSGSPWGWRDDQLYKSIDGGASNVQELRDNMIKTAISPILQSFVFDDSTVKNELAAINNVLEQYGKPIVYGVLKDSPDQDIQNLRERLKKAGSEKVLVEVQKQVDAYLAASIK